MWELNNNHAARRKRSHRFRIKRPSTSRSVGRPARTPDLFGSGPAASGYFTRKHESRWENRSARFDVPGSEKVIEVGQRPIFRQDEANHQILVPATAGDVCADRRRRRRTAARVIPLSGIHVKKSERCAPPIRVTAAAARQDWEQRHAMMLTWCDGPTDAFPFLPSVRPSRASVFRYGVEWESTLTTPCV